MYRKCFLLLLGLTALPVLWGQVSDSDSASPLLTLDEAVGIATAKNADVRISKLNITKAREKVAQTKTNYLPNLSLNVLPGAPLQTLNFTVPAGSFGTYAATGPIPATSSNIQSPQQFGAFIYATATQPLLQLYKINLAVQEARLGTALSNESLRAQQQETRRQVKEAYYQVAQIQAQVESAKVAVQSLTELSTLTQRRLVAQTVLASDSLTVKAKLKQQRYQLLALQDSFDVHKQSLNRLLGRDLRTEFRVEMQPEVEIAESDVEIARKQALQQRPELREAHLQTETAQLDVRRQRAEYIPDLSVQVGYLSFQNFNVLPQNVGYTGILFQWQPYDWGYKKHRIRELKATTQQKSVAEEDAKQKVLLDVEDKFRKLRQARVLLEARTDGREAEQMKLREVTNRYGQQSALLSDLLEQQATLSEADAQYQQALAEFWTARAEFEKALGTD